MSSFTPRRLLEVGLLFAIAATAHAGAPTHVALREELLKMAALDQKARQVAENGDFNALHYVDARNQARLKEIVAQYGWPTFEMVGEDGANASWLLAQHADLDKNFQLEVLALMEPLVQRHQASGKNFAYLYDRTHYPQRFGTQGACVSRVDWQPLEIEDIANVDERRQAFNMPPLRDYIKLFKEACSNPNVVLHSSSDPHKTVAYPTGAVEQDNIPVHFINGLPFVAVTVGTVHTEMMFDSGGSLGISVPESTVAGSGSVTLLPEKAKFSDIRGKVYEVPMLVAKDVVVGRTLLPPVKGRIHVQWGGAPEGPEAALTHAREAGAIGLAAFGDFPVMFDYAHGTMTIYAPGKGPQPSDASWQTLHLEFGKEGPYVMLSVAGKPLKFVLDTGAPYTLIKPDSLPAVASGRCATGTANECDPRFLSDVRDDSGHQLGMLRAQPAALAGAPFDGLLGAPFFSYRRVVFDLAAHRLLITAQDEAASGH